MTTALKSKELETALTAGEANRLVDKKAMKIIVSFRGDNHLKGIEHCKTAMDALPNLQDRYAEKTMVNRLCTLNILLNIRLDRSDDVANYVARMESYVSRLVMTGTDWDEDTRIARLVSSLSELKEYFQMMTSMQTIQKGHVTWGHIKAILLEDCMKLTSRRQSR